MKKRYIVYAVLGAFFVYTACTISGAMKFKALLISHDPRVYFNSIEESSFGKPYYSFKKEVTDIETGNTLLDFKCQRNFIFTNVEYVGFH